MTQSKHTGRVLDGSTKHRGGRSGQSVQYFTVHHCASTSDGNAEYLAYNSAQVSANYCLLKDGTLVRIIPEELAAWTTGPTVDNKSVTVETVNTTGAPNWEVSQAQLEKLALLFLDLCERYGWGRPSRSRIKGHQEWGFATACPGPFLLPRLDWIANRAAQLWDEKQKPRPAWKSLTGGKRLMRTNKAVDVVDVYNGYAKQGNTIAAGVDIEIDSEAVYEGKTWYRSAYSAGKGFDWGMIATSFTEIPSYYKPPVNGVLFGIDKSKWNNIDYAKFDEDFIIHRVNFMEEGTSGKDWGIDGTWKSGVESTRSIGKKVGHYFFNDTINFKTAEEFANWSVNAIKDFIKPGEIVALDVENKGRQTLWNSTQVEAFRKIFKQQLGIDVILYISRSKIPGYQGPIWVADWLGNDGTYHESPYKDWVIHQYTSKNSSPKVPWNSADGMDRNIAKADVWEKYGFKTVETKTETVELTEDIPFKKLTVVNPDLDEEYSEVTTEGAVGKRTVTYEVKFINGEEVSRTETSSKITKEPVDEITTVGSKPKEIPALPIDPEKYRNEDGWFVRLLVRVINSLRS